MSPEGNVTSSIKGAGGSAGAIVGSAVGEGKGDCVGVGVGAGVKEGTRVGPAVGAMVAVGVGVSAGAVTGGGTGVDGAVAVGARVADSWPQAMARARTMPIIAPRGATLVNLPWRLNPVTVFLTTDRRGLLPRRRHDMHIPPNTSSNCKYYKGLCLNDIADESTSYVKIGGTMPVWYL
ncbi:MAG: hypothetical protein BZY88_11355 [SAR202 cluster bacterium Io17-Chloro-G9]|nr:MAG: hypothetical protein BZY88_11355 [SAR202 cluster bacterium Io17-Chloro-G9]